MDVSTFFDYPAKSPEADEARERHDDMVFLGDWSNSDWARLLSFTQTSRVKVGEVVIPYADRDRAIYIVASGRCEALIPNDRGVPARQVEIIESGGIIGEQAFLDGRPRSAEVRAMVDSEVLRLSQEAFEAWAAQEPELARQFVMDLGRIVSIRLRNALKVISAWVR